MKFSILDSLFSHAFSSSNWFKPKYFEWDFKSINGDFVFITDKNVFNTSHIIDIKKYAWLVESPIITPESYEFVFNNPHKFDKIFTHSQKILTLPNSYLLPIGGCHLDEEEISCEYEKTKMISMMYSFKNFSSGHGLRHQIASKFGSVIDVMGSGSTGQHLKKIHSCKDYAYSVVIENCMEDFYFTEKIIDCFLTGTIPIYWGCPSIGKFFNKAGFFTFNTIEELNSIISDQGSLVDFFNSHHDIIIENFNKALTFKIAEDYLFTNYKHIL